MAHVVENRGWDGCSWRIGRLGLWSWVGVTCLLWLLFRWDGWALFQCPPTPSLLPDTYLSFCYLPGPCRSLSLDPSLWFFSPTKSDHFDHFTLIWFDGHRVFHGRTSRLALVVKNPPPSAGDAGDAGLIHGLGRSLRGGHSNPLQYSCLENPTERGVCGLWSLGLQRVGHDWSDLAHVLSAVSHGLQSLASSCVPRLYFPLFLFLGWRLPDSYVTTVSCCLHLLSGFVSRL